MARSPWRQHVLVFAAYVVLALAQSWPLPVHMGTHLTGTPAGDTGVYVWNLWVFSHQIFGTGTTPLSTMEILPLAGGPTDLSLHNYTVFSDLLAVPLLHWLGVVKTFNVIYIFNGALVGFGMFLLARRVTGRVAESFVAGLMFAWAPFIVARGGGHFSLAAAAPLPMFMVMLYRSWETQRVRDALLTGAVMAWAAFCDPYYAVYCLMLGGCFVGSRTFDVSLVRRPLHELQAAKHFVHIAGAVVILLILGVNVLGQGAVRIGVVRISMHTLYTPMLVLTVLVLTRIALSTNFRLIAIPRPSRRLAVQLTAATAVMAGLLMAPTLYAFGERVLREHASSEPLMWRSSAAGVDLLAFLMPNPNHPLAPEAWRTWLTAGTGGLAEQVASISWVGAIVLLAAWRLGRFQPGRLWVWITLGFGLLAMGPFLQIAGLNTKIPGPWALLRYVPLIGAARMPGRMSVVMMMGFCVLVAIALAELGRRYPNRRRLILSVVTVLVVVELLPVPRTLYSASVPSVYLQVAADPRPIRVLELPTGVRDGLSSLGNFNPASQFYQTFHGKGLIGGYLSRVPPSTKSLYRRMPVTAALMAISEGRKLESRQIDRAIAGVDDFIRVTRLGYVIMRRDAVSDDLRDFATLLLGLVKIAEADGCELYVPRSVAPPPAVAVTPRLP